MQIGSWRLAGLMMYALVLGGAALQHQVSSMKKPEQLDGHGALDNDEDFCGNAAAPGPVWVYFGLAAEYLPVFNPLIDTLEDGLRQVLTNTDEPLTLRTSPDMPKMVAEVKQRVEAGCKENPVVICIACMPLPEEESSGTIADTKALQSLTGMGTHLVLYQTEYADFYRQGSAARAHELGAKELWTYSRSILASFPPDHPEITRRYVPPGCASKLLFNVSSDAEGRSVEKVGFLGYLWMRDEATRQSLEQNWNMHQIFKGYASTDEEFRSYMEKFPVQLNIHKNYTEELPMEAFRAAQLLTNGACLLSQPVHPLDYEDFKGLAIFDTIEGLGKLWENSFKGNAMAVRECQEHVQSLYCQRFDPLQLLRKSGFLDSLREQKYTLQE